MKKALEKNHSQTSKKTLKIAVVVLTVLLVMACAVYFAVKVFLGSANQAPSNSAQGSHEAIVAEGNKQEAGNMVSVEVEQMFAGKDVINVLLAGHDRRDAETEQPQQTDAMILCTINKKTNTVTLTSFLEDLWVYVPDLYNQRLNMPYMLGGFSLMNDTLDYNFGIRADYYVEVDFSSFTRAIDILGGVEIQLTSAEAKYMNQHENLGGEENQQWLLSDGVNKLTGAQALAYSRISQLGTDFARTERQQNVLKALALKMKTVGSADLFDYLRVILPLVSTDMTDNQILGLLLEFLPVASDLQIKTQHIPISGQYSFEKKGESDVIVMSREQLELNKKLLWETVRGQ